jgi:hypothetical protein
MFKYFIWPRLDSGQSCDCTGSGQRSAVGPKLRRPDSDRRDTARPVAAGHSVACRHRASLSAIATMSGLAYSSRDQALHRASVGRENNTFRPRCEAIRALRAGGGVSPEIQLRPTELSRQPRHRRDRRRCVLFAAAKNIGYRATRGRIMIHDCNAHIPIYTEEAAAPDFRLLKQF